MSSNGGPSMINPMPHTPNRSVNNRIVKFAAVGGGVMLLGMALMYMLVDLMHLNKHLAYLIQTIITVESNFFLNAAITWPGHHRKGFWKRWLRFHWLKVSTILFAQVLFAGFLFMLSWMKLWGIGMVQRFDYLIAYLGCTAVITVINFIANDKWVFRYTDTEE